MRFSVIVPIYNRPDEIDELLNSLTCQTYADFEVLIIEDGSTVICEDIINSYKDRLDVSYFFKENGGQGFARNYGFERAKGDYFIVFDSDCLIPKNYFEVVLKGIKEDELDAYGGPDAAHDSFTDIQKAISYSMTSPISTGGIRGNKNHVGTFHPRSFNMGISREVYEKTKGYILPKKGEDIEFSIRIINFGFKTGLINEAHVYHKRRTSFGQFYKQLHFFGTARINIFRFFKSELKFVHFFPLFFVLFLTLIPAWYFVFKPFCYLSIGFVLFLSLFNFILATLKYRSAIVGFYSIFTVFIQLTAYGMGFMKEGMIYLRKG